MLRSISWEDVFLYIVHCLSSIHELPLIVVIGDAEPGRIQQTVADPRFPLRHLSGRRKRCSGSGDIRDVVSEYSNRVSLVIELAASVSGFPQNVQGISFVV